MFSYLSQAFLLGLSVGPACLGYCAPVCVPLLGCEKRANWRDTGRTLGIFLAGRLAGYSLTGLVVGLVGSVFFGEMSPLLWASLRVLMGALLIVFGIYGASNAVNRQTRLEDRGRSVWYAASLGLLTGLNLCPPFGAAILGAAAAASVRISLLYFWAFFGGTAVYFLPLLFIGPFSKMEPFRQVARICLFLGGAWLIVQGGTAVLAWIWGARSN